MILTCPDCATRFLIKDEAIGDNGRTVRCSQCAATWFVTAEPDVLSLQDIQNAENASPDLTKLEDPTSRVVPDQPHTPEPVSSVHEAKAEMAPHTVIRARVERKKMRRRIFGVGLIWGVTLMILFSFALFALLFRSHIVGAFPGTASIYKAFGIQATASGLEIYDVETRYGDIEGTPVLFVNGKIKNYDIRIRDLALVKLSFKNARGEELASWVVQPAQSRLEAGKTLDFESQYPNPPIDAVKLSPSFVDEAGPVHSVPVVTQ
ncbi:MAG TPA: hypothetical protein ENJ46_03325 [Hellea balneolensis]|uniref:Zinc finger/thioredoxin putative domain-containing protein n=1 Tax=Hellea balneolensis TaxID=287478 RepID=A0A7C3G8N2_9PROT|nr:hypothetical protein [Hellea balneolensis]